MQAIIELLAKHKLPAAPPGILSEIRYVLRGPDWWLCVRVGETSSWFWCPAEEGRQRVWHPSHYGPP